MIAVKHWHDQFRRFEKFESKPQLRISPWGNVSPLFAAEIALMIPLLDQRGWFRVIFHVLSLE